MQAMISATGDYTREDPHGPRTRSRPALSWRGLFAAVRAAIGALLGLAPHVLHHIGLLAGAALLTGAVGNSILYAAGILLSIPLLNRLRHRFGTWLAPLVGVTAFTVLFGLSAFVIGPLLNPASEAPVPPTPATSDHSGHHD